MKIRRDGIITIDRHPAFVLVRNLLSFVSSARQRPDCRTKLPVARIFAPVPPERKPPDARRIQKYFRRVSDSPSLSCSSSLSGVISCAPFGPIANLTTLVPLIPSWNLHAKLSVRRRRLRRPKRTFGGKPCKVIYAKAIYALAAI